MLAGLAQIYVSLAPPIFAGILNMAWVKTPYVRSLGPIDGGRSCGDGRRVFGDNKTWKGLLGMTGLGALTGLGWGALIGGTSLEQYNLFGVAHDLTPGFNAATGALLGLAYSVAELPNSFLKRRFGVRPGRRSQGPAQTLFVVGDQVDSVIGCAIVLSLLAPVSPALFASIIVVGGLTHVALNLALYAAQLRANPL